MVQWDLEAQCLISKNRGDCFGWPCVTEVLKPLRCTVYFRLWELKLDQAVLLRGWLSSRARANKLLHIKKQL